ncbi:hypothetical protein B0H10DRAFT_693905 [Mycena sp. CBHHK59/15]|nr:hypothetical protein B0H10DRAFT_693905 [Mycena sp. CBHHK59/15]
MSNLTNPTRSQSPEFTHLTSPDPLSPPRPFFFAQDTRRSTASDSDSDKEQPPPLQPRAAYNHRRRSGVASSSTRMRPSPQAHPSHPTSRAAATRMALPLLGFPTRLWVQRPATVGTPTARAATPTRLSPVLGPRITNCPRRGIRATSTTTRKSPSRRAGPMQVRGALRPAAFSSLSNHIRATPTHYHPDGARRLSRA